MTEKGRRRTRRSAPAPISGLMATAGPSRIAAESTIATRIPASHSKHSAIHRGLVLAVGILAIGGVQATSLKTARANPISSTVSMRWKLGNATTRCVTDVCGSPCNQPTDMWSAPANRWHNTMVTKGVTTHFTDTNPAWAELADAAFGGRDHKYDNLDSKHAAYLGGHGRPIWQDENCDATDDCVAIGWEFSLVTESESPTYCWFVSKFGMNSLRLGDDYAMYIDVDSCYSNEPSLSTWLGSVNQGLHQWHGFYGVENPGNNAPMNDYVEAAFEGPAAYAWVEHMTYFDYFPSTGKDLCATSLTRGNTNVDALDRNNNEQYGTGSYSDPTADQAWAYLYYCDCDPNHPNERPIGCD